MRMSIIVELVMEEQMDHYTVIYQRGQWLLCMVRTKLIYLIIFVIPAVYSIVRDYVT